MESVSLFAPASIANISCGFDVLGLCLDNVGDLMHIEKSNKPGFRITEIKGQDLPLETEKNVAGVAAQALLKAYNQPVGFELKIDKRIKAGSGIGSSAASAAGAVFAVNELLGAPYSRAELVQFAMAGEALASGAAHADNLAPVLLGGFTLVRCNATLDIIKLPTPRDLVATVIHPKIELKTIHSRAILKSDIPLQKGVAQWGNLGAFISALYTEDYELLSRSMQDEVIEPLRAMLIPKFNEVKQAALDSGALGSGISGSGPSIFALSRGRETAKKVGDAMKTFYDQIGLDYDVHLSPINQQGIKIL